MEVSENVNTKTKTRTLTENWTLTEIWQKKDKNEQPVTFAWSIICPASAGVLSIN